MCAIATRCTRTRDCTPDRKALCSKAVASAGMGSATLTAQPPSPSERASPPFPPPISKTRDALALQKSASGAPAARSTCASTERTSANRPASSLAASVRKKAPVGGVHAARTSGPHRSSEQRREDDSRCASIGQVTSVLAAVVLYKRDGDIETRQEKQTERASSYLSTTCLSSTSALWLKP